MPIKFAQTHVIRHHHYSAGPFVGWPYRMPRSRDLFVERVPFRVYLRIAALFALVVVVVVVVVIAIIDEVNDFWLRRFRAIPEAAGGGERW